MDTTGLGLALTAALRDLEGLTLAAALRDAVPLTLAAGPVMGEVIRARTPPVKDGSQLQ